jgi:hypothetical protein
MTGISAAEYDAMVAKTMTEKQLQAAIVGAAQRLNWLVYHTHDSRRSQPGFPDLVLVHVTRKVTLFRELKTMRGKVTTEQQQWLDALTNAGQDAAVWRPNDWLGTTIQDTLYPPSGGTQ